MEKQPVKSILLRIKAKGHGIVNYDSTKQIDAIREFDIRHLKPDIQGGKTPSNTNYAKKRFFKKTDNKGYGYKIIVSPQAVGKAIFGDEQEFTSVIPDKEELYLPYIASKSSLLRGYMKTFGKNTTTIIRKSPVRLPEFIQINDAVSSLDIGTKSGDRTDTSLYYKENIGDIEYESLGHIDLKELQFVSLDSLYGRQALSQDNFSEYSKYLKLTMPDFDGNIGYYQTKLTKNKIPECGFLLNAECQVELVQFFLKNLAKAKINRKNAYFEISKIEFKFVYDPLTDTADDETGWETLNFSDIDSLSFNPHLFYDQVEDGEAKDIQNIYINEVKEKVGKKQERINKKKLNQSN